jgi:hypothetical protein
VGLEVQGSDDNGHTGTNGLVNSLFQLNESDLANAASTPLFNAQSTLHGNVLQLLANTGGPETFGYATKCALPTGTVVTDGVTFYKGHGILNSTTMWPTTGLNLTAQADLMACMAVHLNPSGVTVPIKLAGPSVISQDASEQPDGDEYTFREALWGAENLTGTNPWRIHVWPLRDAILACSQSITDAMKTRVCGQGLPDCDLVVHTNLDDCTEATDGYTSCDGMTVIQTWLKPADVTTLLPACVPPPPV